MELLDTELTHAYIIHDMMIRTLERDLKELKKIKGLKTEHLLIRHYENSILKVRTEQANIKKQMAAKKTFFQSEFKINEQFTGFYFTLKGGAQELRYANYALRNKTLQALESYFNI